MWGWQGESESERATDAYDEVVANEWEAYEMVSVLHGEENGSGGAYESESESCVWGTPRGNDVCEVEENEGDHHRGAVASMSAYSQHEGL